MVLVMMAGVERMEVPVMKVIKGIKGGVRKERRERK
jgi:hypothetical protein